MFNCIFSQGFKVEIFQANIRCLVGDRRPETIEIIKLNVTVIYSCLIHDTNTTRHMHMTHALARII